MSSIDHLSSEAERLLRFIGPDFRVARGSPLPLGASFIRDGINFALFAKHATDVRLILFAPHDGAEILELPLDRQCHTTGDIWHVAMHNLDPRIQYAWRCDRDPNTNPTVYRYDDTTLLLDPYAKAISGGSSWGKMLDHMPGQRRCLVVDDEFDWEFDQPLQIPLSDSVIYETHVRGFTRHPSSGVTRPGRFLGLVEKIPYLKELGVTAVELLPVQEFEEADTDRKDPTSGEPLLNLWGYQPVAYFAPNASYASLTGQQVVEFKDMVKQFHRGGLEVILDVVFNHTAEGDERGPTWSFRGIDNAIYYMLEHNSGKYLNYSGCGNTFNCNHPVVRDLIVSCLRYWVMEMHVDGFRFDLASILGRGQDGAVLANPPLLEALANDPVLAQTKLIAEAWDAGGLYQVGTFPAWGRWAEWNGKFRDDIRRFVKGDSGMVPALATRLIGSPDLYESSQRHPYHSINFVTCHDGFTLADLVSYNEKHNDRNGEENRDGTDANYSWNCGAEGPSDSEQIRSLRSRQQRNFAAILLISSGVPMIAGGDEFGRTQQGNNNAYCQDNEIGWVDWRLAASNADLVRFFRLMIAFRASHPVLRRNTYTPDKMNGGVNITWHGVKLNNPDWGWDSRSLAMWIQGMTEEGAPDHIYFITNAHWEAHDFELPQLERMTWRRFVDTSLDAPAEITEPGQEAALIQPSHYTAGPRSVVILIGLGR